MSEMVKKLEQILLTPEEAARSLAISTRQLRDLTQTGNIRFVNIGQGERVTRRYRPGDIEEFIQERLCQSSNAPAQPSTPTTFVFGANDFQALLDARRNAKRSGQRKPPATGPSSTKSTHQSR